MARILIVDDSIVMRRNLRNLLVKLGHEVAGEAADGAEAFNRYIETKPDIVTMDISMPETNGIEATTRILEFDPDAMIIVISALQQKKDVLLAINAGAKYFIVKPYSDVKVRDVIEQIMSAKEE